MNPESPSLPQPCGDKNGSFSCNLPKGHAESHQEVHVGGNGGTIGWSAPSQAKCDACDGSGEIGDYVGLEMRCVGVECDSCKGTGIKPVPIAPLLRQDEPKFSKPYDSKKRLAESVEKLVALLETKEAELTQALTSLAEAQKEIAALKAGR